ncbi:MAG: NUDIX hydrolase [Bacillota bacterium]
MESEKLKIFDENRKFIGVETRAVVHKKGHWHETFHLWLVNREDNEVYVLFQLRSKGKKDYPNLLDITAAGHLLASESVEDGVREVKEEIGVVVTMDELIPLGIIPYINQHHEMIDKELAHVFLLEKKYNMEDFQLQHEEVSGIAKVKIKDFIDLWKERTPQILATGFRIDDSGERADWEEYVTKNHFVHHEDRFYFETFSAINSALKRESE